MRKRRCGGGGFSATKEMKRILSLLLTVIMLTSLVPFAGAANSGQTSEKTADKLHELNLFQGTDNGYELGATPTRMQALVMLIRLLGLEEEALAYSGKPSPFTDLTWGEDYAHYAFNTGLTKGTSATTFSPNNNMAPSDYVTFLLRALGYTENAGDYTWGTQLEFAQSVGLVDNAAVNALYSVGMNRGDMVDLSFAALTCKTKSSTQTLAEKLVKKGVFTKDTAVSVGAIGAGQVTFHYKPAHDFTTSYERKTIATSEGNVSAHVVRVNTSDPRVTVKAALVNNTIGATADFKSIVESSGGAVAVFNANFFEAYEEFKSPIGHIMVDGTFLHGASGASSLGITKYGELSTGSPSLFTRIETENGRLWAMYEINGVVQSDYVSILYTPNFGETVTFKVEAYALTIVDGKLSSYTLVPAGTAVPIPDNGYICFMGKEFTATEWFRTPVLGESAVIEPYLREADPEGFTLENMDSIISGGPRLVQDGSLVTTLGVGFNEPRFTTLSTCRTAVGIDSNGYLVLVSVPTATIQQMRELMLALGCVDAFNLDGGGSCAMYYKGTYYSTPGRKLTATIQVFVED